MILSESNYHFNFSQGKELIKRAFYISLNELLLCLKFGCECYQFYYDCFTGIYFYSNN